MVENCTRDWNTKMDVLIFRDQALNPDKLVGRIDERGKVYDLEGGRDRLIGSVYYEDGEVYDGENMLLGWIEEEGTIVRFFNDENIKVGFITPDGEIYGYDEDEQVVCRGRVTGLQDNIEGAAAMLFFFNED